MAPEATDRRIALVATGEHPFMGSGIEDTVAQLQHETAKWAERLATALATTEALDAEGERFLTNIRAYQSDAEHFEHGGDLVRAFEAVVWAWAWLEIGADIGVLDAPALNDR